MENKKLTEKQEAASITDDALIHVVEPNDISQGPDGSSFKFKASNLNLAGQDNIDMRKYVNISSIDGNAQILAKINNLPQYTVDEKQSVWFITRQRAVANPLEPAPTFPGWPVPAWEPQRILKYKMLNKGKGTYGSGGIQLVQSDLELLYDNTETTGDIENDPTTDIIDFGTLSGQTISQWLNIQSPALVIQSQEDGYTLFKGMVNGTPTTYLWVGEPGVYGSGETASEITDFQELSNTPPTGLDQNNLLVWFNFGEMQGEGYVTPANVADWLNSQPWSLNIGEKSTPVVFEFTRYVGDTNTKFIFLFSRGKGIWGKANGAVTDFTKWFYASNIKALPPAPVTIEDIENDPNAVFHDLGTINDGNYLDVANTLSTWDLTDSGEGEPGQTITHYFTYIENGITKILRFKGVPGTYGSGETQFVENDFAPMTNSNVLPQIEYTSQITNDGEDSSSRYAQDSEIYESSAINLLDISQVDYTERYSPGGNNIVSRSGTAFVRTDWIPVEEGKTYILNKSFPYADNTIGLFTAYGATTSVAKITANTSGNISFTIPEGLAVTHIIINLTTTVVNGDILSSTDYMLNEGFRSIPYISFGSHSYIKDELLVPVDYSKIDDNDLFELRSTNLIDVRRVVNTERYSPGGNNIVSRGITRFVRTDWIPVEEGKWYIINKNLNGRGGYFSTYGNTTAVSSIDFISTSQGTSYMFYVPTGQNIKYAVLNLSTTTTTGNTLLYDDYQLEKGGVSTPHKEYLLKPQIKSTYLKDPYNESNLRKYITFDNINYSGTSSKIVKFKEHWIKKDKDLVVVTTGTSLTGRNTEHCTEHAFASSRPPLMNSNNFATHIWDALVWEGQQYRRYDSGGFFTETGTWITSGGIADWDDNGYRTALTRYSTGGAFIGFGIPSGAWQFNFIYRTDFNATENAIITIIEGNGLVEVFNGTTWVEANGYVFSQKEPDITLLPSVSYVNPITGATDILTDYQTKGNTTYQKRLKMRCKNHSGLDSRSVGKTVTITNTTGRLTYWGVEWSPREFMITYINAARGSHNGTVDSSLSLLHYQDNDVWGFDPDLLLIENPIHNSGGNGIPDPSYPTTYWGQTTDGFFFEDSGVSLKSRAEDLGVFVSDLEWIVYNSSIAYNFGGIDTAGSLIPSTNIDGKVLTALDAQQLSHQWMVDNHPEVMSFNLVKNWVDAALDVYGNLRTSTVGSGKAGLTFTNEGSHWNDTGCKVQARLIVPVFDFNLDNF